jgi:hypothetical protein
MHLILFVHMFITSMAIDNWINIEILKFYFLIIEQKLKSKNNVVQDY